MPSEEQSFVKKLLKYELNAAERYRRFVSVVMVASADGLDKIKHILQETLRSSDIMEEYEGAAVVLMSETDSCGALSAIARYRERIMGRTEDLRFALATYPNDEGGADGLFDTAARRLQNCSAREFGAVAMMG